MQAQNIRTTAGTTGDVSQRGLVVSLLAHVRWGVVCPDLKGGQLLLPTLCPQQSAGRTVLQDVSDLGTSIELLLATDNNFGRCYC